MSIGWSDLVDSPFHEGERRAQERMGARDIEAWARKAIRPWLPEQHRAFYRELPFLVLAARDAQERPWVTLVAGKPGFVASPDDRSLALDASFVAGDALNDALGDGLDVGILGIELATRRRNRVNGRLAPVGDKLQLSVSQSFGNCPQYIHERQWVWKGVDDAGTPKRRRTLSNEQQARIAAADTFFIASGYRGRGEHASFGMDASHRGGEPGFVRVDNDRRIVFPDYAGNNHYNTIGNLMLDPRVGLTFVDFDHGSLLQLTGKATIDWDSDEVRTFPGAQRLVVVDLDEIVELPRALPIRWMGDGDTVRTLRVVAKVQESEDVASFILRPRDGGAISDFEPGQHLPIELDVEGQKLRRTYSLSNGPGQGEYRITVKREPFGLVSRLLHEAIDKNDFVVARRPAGDFVLAPGDHAAVLISAGVGITPMVSMLHELSSPKRQSPVWFIHGARDGAHLPLRSEVEALANRRAGIAVHTTYSRANTGDVGAKGRVDGALIAKLVGRVPDAHYYLCGPTRFMASVQASLESLGIDPATIHSESFGPIRQSNRQ